MKNLKDIKSKRETESKKRQELLETIEATKQNLQSKKEAIENLSTIMELKKTHEAFGLGWNFKEEDLEKIKKKRQ